MECSINDSLHFLASLLSQKSIFSKLKCLLLGPSLHFLLVINAACLCSQYEPPTQEIGHPPYWNYCFKTVNIEFVLLSHELLPLNQHCFARFSRFILWKLEPHDPWPFSCTFSYTFQDITQLISIEFCSPNFVQVVDYSFHITIYWLLIYYRFTARPL